MEFLREQLLSLLDLASYDAFFDFAEKYVGLVGELASLRLEFINGTTDAKFLQRLRTWANTHIEASKEGIAGFDAKKFVYNRDVEYVMGKTKQNRGVGTSEVLQDKTADDLQPDDLALLFRQDEVLERLGIEANKMTAQEKLRILTLAENGHIYKGTFLTIGKHYQFRAVCESALESKFTYFKGIERLDDIAFKDVTGNILSQYNQMMFLLLQHIPKRRDRSRDKNVYEVPIEALREFVANAFVHRDYSQDVRTTVYVEIFDDRIEIRNPGAFPKGIKPNQVLESNLINPTIMTLFMLHKHVEQKGTGIRKAQNILQKHGLPKAKIQQIKTSSPTVRVTIYRPKKEDDYVDTSQNVAQLYEKIGKYAEALPSIEKILGKDTTNYIANLKTTTALYKKISEYAEALPNIEKILGKQSFDYAITLNSLASLFEIMGEIEKAMLLYKEASQIYEQILGKNN